MATVCGGSLALFDAGELEREGERVRKRERGREEERGERERVVSCCLLQVCRSVTQ